MKQRVNESRVSSPNNQADSAPAYFLTTHWSLVLRAAGQDSASAHEALCELCRNYWYPLYSYARRQGQSPPDAEDLTQGFFARLLEKNYVADANRNQGRFRSFLLTAFKHFLANDWDRKHAQKRGGFRTVVEIDQAMAEARFESDFHDPHQPDVQFDRQWVTTLLERVMSQLRGEYSETGRSRLFEVLKDALVKDDDARSYSEMAVELNVTEPAVKAAVQRMRARYREILRLEIGRTVSSPGEIDDELRHLFALFSA